MKSGKEKIKDSKESSYSFFLKNANPPTMPMSAVGRQQHVSAFELPAAPVLVPLPAPPSRSAFELESNTASPHVLPTSILPVGQ